MFGEKSEAIKLAESSQGITTIIDKEASFEGKLTFEGGVVINGKFKGEIFSEGILMVGEGGYVEGSIEIGEIQIQGEVHGNIKAKTKIEINAPAIVRGDITAPSLIIKEGAIFEGNCSMGNPANRQNVVELSQNS